MQSIIELITQLNAFDIIQVIVWGLAGAISFYFSIGNARVWTSITTGFFLIFLSRVYAVNPWLHFAKLSAFHYIIGAVAIMVITHGFLEYYVFCKTFEITGNKLVVYLSTLGILAAAGLFLMFNPDPSFETIRNYKMVDNAIWVFLSLINIELIRKIYHTIQDSTISRGFIAFCIVFLFIFVWKGSELYLQVYQWDKEWMDNIAITGKFVDTEGYLARIKVLERMNTYAGLLSGLSVGGTFIFIYRLLK